MPNPMLFTLSAAILLFAGRCAGQDQQSLDEARRRMVEEQLERRDIEDPKVLAAMGRVPRHRFVPEALQFRAYADHPLPIGSGQTISQPYIVALMTQLAELEPDDSVLEIGTGSGYQAAVLAEIVREVYTIEIVPELAERAKALLAELGYRNVTSRTGDGYVGWKEAAPFDAILVTAAPPEVPQPLLEQLAPGGILVIPVGPQSMTQRLLRIEKSADGSTTTREIIPVVFVPLVRER
ncbi:MAG TPA: protein-L-isoaspartate(D-aspartate) O-methyltransferase [Vicinamibacteria bacterium]|jgi:protein-L-isoaspartate(D-aspartate) O-methyltransferase